MKLRKTCICLLAAATLAAGVTFLRARREGPTHLPLRPAVAHAVPVA